MTPSQLDEIVDDLLSEIPLQERVLIANMDAVDIAVLLRVLGVYIKHLAGGDVDEKRVLYRLWERLRESHKLRLVQ